MSSLDHILALLGSSMSVYLGMQCYSKLRKNYLFKFNLKVFLIIIISGILVAINTYTNLGYTRPFINFLILLSSILLYYKDDIFSSTLYLFFSYIIMTFFEIVLSFILELTYNDLKLFDNNLILKVVFSILPTSFGILILYINSIRELINKCIRKISSNKIIFIIISVSLTILFIIDVKYTVAPSTTAYIVNIIILFSTILLLVTNIISYFRINNEIHKSEVLLNFMSKYEKIIEEEKINKHEMLNNLLMLKSFQNKNSKEYNDTLDELISIYNTKGYGVKNIYKLPTGLKGIFYYKLKDLNDKNYNININISKNIVNSFKKIDHKVYVSLYKIIGILLDNAIEAASKTKDKLISVDIHKDNKNINIIIDNSFKNKVDLNKINEKNYSTKGKNRGLGLYIVNNILKNYESIELKYEINNKIFSSIVTIKMS